MRSIAPLNHRHPVHRLFRLQVLTPLSLLINIATLLVCSVIVKPSVGKHHAYALLRLEFSSCSRVHYRVTPYIDIAFAKHHRCLCRRYTSRANRLLHIAGDSQEAGDKGKRIASEHLKRP